MSNTIDTPVAREMVAAAAVRGASIIGQPGGWSVMLKIGMTEKPLGTQRTDKPRTWRSLDSCIAYLRDELHIVRVDGVDATNYSDASVHRPRRADSAARMKAAHEAAAHDKWFREQVDLALAEADDPATQWRSNEDVKREFAGLRAELASQVKAHA